MKPKLAFITFFITLFIAVLWGYNAKTVKKTSKVLNDDSPLYIASEQMSGHGKIKV